MAVESTPERSFSLLLRSSRAADATTGCGRSPRCNVVIMARSVASIGWLGIREEGGDTGKSLVHFGIENVQNRADQKCVAAYPQIRLEVIAVAVRAACFASMFFVTDLCGGLLFSFGMSAKLLTLLERVLTDFFQMPFEVIR
jgi:hypothetical protein